MHGDLLILLEKRHIQGTKTNMAASEGILQFLSGKLIIPTLFPAFHKKSLDPCIISDQGGGQLINTSTLLSLTFHSLVLWVPMSSLTCQCLSVSDHCLLASSVIYIWTDTIPHGGILGPIVFLAFINDMPKHVTSKCCLFTDDRIM